MKKIIIYCFILALHFVVAQVQPELKRQAQSFMNSGRYGEAIELLNKYIPLNPQDHEAYNMRGLCYEKRTQYEEAITDYRRAAKLQPNNKTYSDNVARIRNNWNEIITKRIEGYKRDLVRNPNNYSTYLKLASSYKDLEKYNEAEKWYDDYNSKKQFSANEAIEYADMLIKINKLKKAENIITIAINANPNDHRLYSKRGWIRNWLGDYKNAIVDFEKALSFKPFFKEAQDGLDNAKGKGYNFTIIEKDTGRARFEFAIDKYNRILQKYPNKDDIRFLLIEELLKYKRIQEAQTHLLYLQEKYSSNEKYLELWNRYEALRDTTFNQQVRSLKDKIAKNPNDKRSILQLMRLYANNQLYEPAIELGENYIINNFDYEVAYETALYSSYNLQYDKALSILQKLTSFQPNNSNYLLLYAKICIWKQENLEDAKEKLNNIIKKEPKNFEAIKALAMLYIILKDYNLAEQYLEQARKLDYDNYELRKLYYIAYRNQTENNKLNDYDIVNNLQLENQDEYLDNEKILISMMNKYPDDEYFTLKLANLYLINKSYSDYIQTIDKIIDKDNYFEYTLIKIKNLQWEKQHSKALELISQLEKEYPQDVNLKYLKLQSLYEMKNYKSSKIITDEYNTKFPNNYTFNLYASWFPGEYYTKFKFAPSTFPTFMNVVPEIFTFSDNQYFQYQYQGARFELGINKFMNAAFTLQQGKFSSTEPINSTSNKFVNSKILLNFMLSNELSSSITVGSINFGDRTKKLFTQLDFNYKESEYDINATFLSTDARFLVYSPKLLFYQLNTIYSKIYGSYNITEDTKLSLSTSLIIVDGPVYAYQGEDTLKYKNNGGNDINIRLSKKFYPELNIGYEYYLNKYVHTVAEYYSPKNFESHGVFGEWKAYNDKNISLVINGKVGYVFATDFIVKEINLLGSYKFNYNFSLYLNVNFGSSARYETAYSSRMFNLYLVWSL
ncbi:MAG TPA: tetratricopeptide repeat protein [Ignavibacteriales bacterium]|nr:tetratricopeptide repeat protein [Ignavibacteriales bacterium]HOL81304.1 tetratricopeptide repeat protein [Ignavibacteriales bacterium]HOM66040.1 tetratricopeptide repeat protein [Ignavibacteriales bacterium]HPD67532.1 tetratricopeptide repeat protein [Ignavibacteriales bacterium]HRR19288.1 tetratricopeptide repeat protein [Ignavibacteriales bacterium]